MTEYAALELDLKIQGVESLNDIVASQIQVKRGMIDLREERNKLNKQIKELRKNEELTAEQRERALKGYVGDLVKVEKELKDLGTQQKSLNRDLKGFEAAKGSVVQLKSRLKGLEAQFDKLGNTAKRKSVGKEITKIRTELKKLNAEKGITTFGSKMTSVFSKFSRLAAGLGLVIGLQALTSSFTDAVQVGAEFSKQIAFLGAVSQASNQEIAELEANAKKLGETTQFTASQVAQLEIEYAKLGFKPAEILAATADTLNLAAVAQADLGDTARVTASVMKAFNIPAEQTGRVADVMAKSFSSSALNLEKFSTSMAHLAPVAANANVTLEEATALTGILADRGLDASVAGTSLRNIFLEIAKKGITLNEAFKQINTSTDGNVKALELFGKRGATAAIILAKNQKATEGLNTALKDSVGFAERAGEAIIDNLKGDLDILKSAVEGLKLNFIDLTNDGIRNTIQFLTALTSAFSQFIKVPVSEKLRDEQIEFNALVGAIISVNDNQEVRNGLIKELQTKYPEYIGNLNLEKASTEELQDLLSGVNEQLAKKIILQEQEEEIAKVIGKQVDLTRSQIEAEKKLQEIRFRISEGEDEFTLGLKGFESPDVLEKQIEFYKKSRKEYSGQLSDAFNEQKKLFEKFGIDVEKETKETGEQVNENLVEGVLDVNTISILKERLSELKKSLNDTEIGSKAFKDLRIEIKAVEKELKIAQGTFKDSDKTFSDLAAGSISFLRKQLTELNKQLKGESNSDSKTIEILEQIVDKEAELKLIEDAIKGIKAELSGAFDPERFFLDTAEIEQEFNQFSKKLGSGTGEIEIPGFVIEGLNKSDNDDAFNATDKLIEYRRLKAIELARELIQDEEQFNEARKSIDLQSENEIIQSRLDSGKLALDEELALIVKKADNEVLINKTKDERIAANRQKIFDLLNIALEATADILGGIGDLQDARTDADIAAIETKYQKEIDAAEGNSARIKQIEEKRDAEIEKIERKAFERQKRFSQVQAAINGALAITKIWAEVPKADFGIATGFLIAAAAASTLTQIAAIEAQKFAEGGILKGKSHAGGGVQLLGKDGQHYGEAEGREIILKKTVTDNDKARGLASFINQSQGGVSLGGSSLPSELQEQLKRYLVPNSNLKRFITPKPATPYFSQGGITQAITSAGVIIDYDKLAAKLGAEFQKIPPQYISIKEFREEESTFVKTTENTDS